MFPVRTAAVCSGLACLSVLAVTARSEARPQYLKEFSITYPQAAEAVAKARCFTCHGAEKKETNRYGSALKELLAGGNVKEPERILEALKTIEPMPSSEQGKTFGDLLGEGKLPQ